MKFSVIIPVYNAARYLREAIDSVLAQTYKHFELICIDDGSTDGSAAILDEYAERFSGRVKVIHQANQGVSAARNRGLDEAKGEWIAWIDADDMYAPWRLQEAAEIIEHERPDVVRFRSHMSESFSADCFSKNGYHVLWGEKLEDWVWNTLMPAGMMWTFVARRELFENNRFVPGMRIKEEAPVIARMARRITKAVQSESVSYFYRQILTSAMHSKRRVEDCLTLLEEMRRVFVDCGYNEIAAQRIRMHCECDIIDWVLANPNKIGLNQIRAKYLELRRAGVFKVASIQQIRYRIPMWWFDKTGYVWIIHATDFAIRIARKMI